MSKVRDILSHITVEVPKRKRKCHHSQRHSIAAGEACLVINNSQGLGSRNYCYSCAMDILRNAARKLNEYISMIESSNESQTDV